MVPRKIYRVRHLEHMIYLTKRAKRTHCVSKADHKRIDWHIKNYERLLEIVQDS